MNMPDSFKDVLDYNCDDLTLVEELSMAVSGTLAAFRNIVSELEELGVWNGVPVMCESKLHNQLIIFTLIDADVFSDDVLFFVNIAFEENFNKQSLRAYMFLQLCRFEGWLNEVPEYFRILVMNDVQHGTGISRMIIDQVRFIGLTAVACSGKVGAENIKVLSDHLRLLESELIENGLSHWLSEPIPEHQSSLLHRRLGEVGLDHLLEIVISDKVRD